MKKLKEEQYALEECIEYLLRFSIPLTLLKGSCPNYHGDIPYEDIYKQTKATIQRLSDRLTIVENEIEKLISEL